MLLSICRWDVRLQVCLLTFSCFLCACGKKEPPAPSPASAEPSTIASAAPLTPEQKMEAWTKLPPKTFEGTLELPPPKGTQFTLSLVEGFEKTDRDVLGPIFTFDRIKTDLLTGPSITLGVTTWQKDIDAAAFSYAQSLKSLYDVKVVRKEVVGDRYVLEAEVGSLNQLVVQTRAGKDAIACTAHYDAARMGKDGVTIVVPWLQKMCSTLTLK